MKQKSKFFRVATEGASTDGRKITRAWIQQMAANYDPAKYGARVWLEHIRGIMADSAFGALGDVTALEAREVEDGKLALFAQIDPTPELIQINQKRQKIFTSIEVAPEFADTGEAYLMGLAVTDSPASLGTEALKFCAQRKQADGNLFTAAIEADINFTAGENPGPGLLERVKAMFSKKGAQDDARSQDQEAAILELARQVEAVAASTQGYSALKQAHDQIKGDLDALRQQFNDLLAELDETPGDPPRPPASGGDGQILTDC